MTHSTDLITAQRNRNTSLYSNASLRPVQAGVQTAILTITTAATLTAGDFVDLAFLKLGKVKIRPEQCRLINTGVALASVFTLQKVDTAGVVTNLSRAATLAANSVVALVRNFSAWVTSTAYAVGDTVATAGVTYTCLVAHTSGTFATDLAAAKWAVAASSSSAPEVAATDYLRLLVGTVTTGTAGGQLEIEITYSSEEAAC